MAAFNFEVHVYQPVDTIEFYVFQRLHLHSRITGRVNGVSRIRAKT